MTDYVDSCDYMLINLPNEQLTTQIKLIWQISYSAQCPAEERSNMFTSCDVSLRVFKFDQSKGFLCVVIMLTIMCDQ